MYKTKTITEADQWAGPLDLIGYFNCSAQGTFTIS